MRWREERRDLPFQDSQQGLLECDDDALRNGDVTRAEWMVEYSQEVALARGRTRECTVTGTRGEDDVSREKSPPRAPFPAHIPFDPLHLPSLFVFSLSLFAPLKERVASAMGSLGVQVALLGGFCVGFGVGVCVGGW
jgi:hypothetical protein